MPDPYPSFLPELQLSPDEQTAMNNKSFKHWLVSTFFHERVERTDGIYLEYRDGHEEYMPLFTMTKALAHYNAYEEGRDGHRAKFKRLATTLHSRMEWDGDMAGWKHEKHLQLPGYPPIQASYSALINGRGLGVIIRLRHLTGDASLNDAITGILNAFETESDDGGVRKTEGDDTYYLEYSYGNDSPVVYNGFYSALIALYDAYQHAPRKEQRRQAKQLFDDAFQTMLRSLDDAELRTNLLDWLRYDDNQLFFADGDYIDIEISQLKTLHDYTGNDDLERRVNDWEEIKAKNAWRASLFEWPYFLYKRLLPKQYD